MSTNEKLGPGMVLGRYELLLPVAQGGMATVWAARQRGSRGFQKTVAIKTMLPTLTEDPQFEQMFLDEAALAAKIHHPNVCEILDLGEQDEILYIVMEWIDGEAMSVIHKAARKNQAQIPIRLGLRMLGQACAGLHAAHELSDENDVPLQLVHRDVSPQNILVTYDGIVKLVDFGVAKAMGRAGGDTTAGQLKGKVPYMSPEQARGGTVDRRTDIFAMGIVLYKIATGLHPFMGENDLVTMRNIISRPLLPPRVKNPAFPAEVEQILLRCLQKDPDKRFQTMAELASAVERTVGSLGGGEEDLGTYVRTLMGERGAKRRAAVRDAVRAADERFATGTHPMVVLPGMSEPVADLVLTRLNSGVKDPMLTVDRTSATPAAGVISNQSGEWPAMSAPPPESSSGMAEQSSTTEQPVVSTDPGLTPPPRRARSGLLFGVAAAALAGLGITAWLVAGPRGAAHGGTTATAPVVPSSPPPPPSPATVAVPMRTATAAPEPTAVLSASTSTVRGDSPPEAAVKRPPPPPLAGRVPAPKPTSSATATPGKRINTSNVPTFTKPDF